MSKGSAIVGMLVAFLGGIVLGTLVPKGEGGEESAEVTAEGGAAGADLGPGNPNSDRVRVPVTPQQPSKGPADALVTIVEFSDFECPFCSRVNPTMAQIMERYRGKVRVVWRNAPLPFHQNAVPAAEAAMEAMAQGGSTKFWQMHDVLFQNQRALTGADLERYAQQIGLDMTRFRRAMEQHTHRAAVEADNAIARQVGANGTPNFFINGKNVVGAVPIEQFTQVIDAEIANAEQMVTRGTARNAIYTTLMRDARASVAPAGAAGAGGAAPAPQPQQRPGQPDAATTYKIEITGREPMNGPADALVTIVQFSDFECPFCSRVEPTLTQLRTDYGNDLRIVWMNNPLPFHQNAKPAAMAAMEAFQQGGNAKFWQMHAKLFEHSRELTRPNLETWAQELGLNMAQFRAALDNNEHQAAIDASQQLGRRFGANGTPAFFINGRFLSGAQPIDNFKRLVDEELAKARRLVSSGTPRARIYAAVIATGATEVAAGPAPAPGGDQPPAEDPNKIYNIPVPANAPSRGPANARVTIQLFSDFQCPFCTRIEPTMAQIVAQYGNRVRIVWRDYPLPFHPNAKPAAEAAREVFAQGGAAKFWAYHDLLFQNQQTLDRATLERLAEQVGGIDMTRFRAALDSHRHQAAVEADAAAITAAGISRFGTPTSFINGKKFEGALDFSAFQAAIDAALR